MARSRRSGADLSPALLVVIGTAIGLVLLVAPVMAATPPPPDTTMIGYTTFTAPPTDRFLTVIAGNDGQAYYALARDPLMREPDMFLRGEPDAAYFAGRPLLVYALWATSLGQPALLPAAFILVCALSLGLFLGAAAVLLRDHYGVQRTSTVLWLLALPAMFASIFWGPTLLAGAAALWGLHLWLDRPDRRGWAAVFLVLATLGRESLLLVPLVLGIEALVRRTLTLADALRLLAAPVAFGVWQLVIRQGYGEPTGKFSYNFSTPGYGIWRTASVWGPVDVLSLLLLVGLVVAALIRAPRDVLAHLAVAHLVFGLILSTAVWVTWENPGRILLPAFVLPILVLVGHEASARHPRPEPTDLPA